MVSILGFYHGVSTMHIMERMCDAVNSPISKDPEIPFREMLLPCSAVTRYLVGHFAPSLNIYRPFQYDRGCIQSTLTWWNRFISTWCMYPAELIQVAESLCISYIIWLKDPWEIYRNISPYTFVRKMVLPQRNKSRLYKLGSMHRVRASNMDCKSMPLSVYTYVFDMPTL